MLNRKAWYCFITKVIWIDKLTFQGTDREKQMETEMTADLVNLPWDKLQNSPKVAIIGDLILDEYLKGSVDRISPEAPVPVHLVRKAEVTAGGAANTARNVALAGGRAIVFGVVGKDDAARQLIEIMKNDGIDVSAVMQAQERPTIRKTRVTANNQQIVRIDWERTSPIEKPMQSHLMNELKKTQ